MSYTHIKSVGKYSYGIENIRIKQDAPCTAQLIIGKFCSIAPNVEVLLGGNHRYDWLTTYPFGEIHKNIWPESFKPHLHTTNGDVIIENDVWIAQGVTIMSGITIGSGAVIATNSHVVKNVEPYSIVGGNPARLIKHRFSKEIIDLLLELRWWDQSEDFIRENLKYLMNGINDDTVPTLKRLIESTKRN